MRQQLRGLTLSPFLSDAFEFCGFRIVDINHLYVGLRPLTAGKAKYMPITEAPHYMFVQHILRGAPQLPVQAYRDYTHYILINPDSCNEDHFVQLIKSIKLNGYDADKMPILVFRNWRRTWPLGRWDVADGFHRLAILAAMGETSIQVMTLRYKKSIFRRAWESLLRSI